MGGTWTIERIEAVKTLWADGKTSGEIAAILGDGITRNAVIGRVHRMRLARGHVTERDRTPTPTKHVRPAPRHPWRRAASVEAGNGHSRRPVLSEIVTSPTFTGCGVGLLDLRPHHCRSIRDERGADGLAIFCGDVRQEGSSYCRAHTKEYLTGRTATWTRP